MRNIIFCIGVLMMPFLGFNTHPEDLSEKDSEKIPLLQNDQQEESSDNSLENSTQIVALLGNQLEEHPECLDEVNHIVVNINNDLLTNAIEPCEECCTNCLSCSEERKECYKCCTSCLACSEQLDKCYKCCTSCNKCITTCFCSKKCYPDCIGCCMGCCIGWDSRLGTLIRKSPKFTLVTLGLMGGISIGSCFAGGDATINFDLTALCDFGLASLLVLRHSVIKKQH